MREEVVMGLAMKTRQLGLDAVDDREKVQRRIGYLPGDFVAYPDLTAGQYLRYLANLRGGVVTGALAMVLGAAPVLDRRDIAAHG